MSREERIHREMTIEDIFATFPHKAELLKQEMSNIGLQCAGCQAATWETLEDGMRGHGLPESAIDDLVQRLNEVLDGEEHPDTITLTPRAAAKYLEILEEEGKQGWGLRFGDRMSGCSGFAYVLDYAEAADAERDDVFTSQGIEIFVEKASTPRLLGSTIDYVSGLQGAGFKVSNPNVRASCGCGSSHGY